MSSQGFIEVEVTVKKTVIPTKNGEKLAPVTLHIDDKLRYDEEKKELIIKLPQGVERRVKLTKSELERFTKYI